jgi:hypothetical protein
MEGRIKWLVSGWLVSTFLDLMFPQTVWAQTEGGSVCTKAIRSFLTSDGLAPCAQCHSKNAGAVAPKWMASEAALQGIWSLGEGKNEDHARNIILAKAQSKDVRHGGGKNFEPERIEQIKSGLQELIKIQCLSLAATKKIGESLIIKLPYFTNVVRRFEALVGLDSSAVRELNTYGLQLGRGDFKVNPNSRLMINPGTASILERVIQMACQDLAQQRAWAPMEGEMWKKELAAFIREATGIPSLNAVRESGMITSYFKDLSQSERAVLSCAVVLRSEKFLIP